ncbi:MAG: prepilin-type N-terminal cleavage/methylation domain-containing protein [Acidobacteriota bacterium]
MAPDGRPPRRKALSRWAVRRQDPRGFTLIELLLVSAIFVALAAIGTPMLGRAIDAYRLGMASRAVERELQTARLAAVTANRMVRVRFDCPATGEFRRVEVLGAPGVPDALDAPVARCSEATYPYPPPDNNPLTRPNHDGPIRRLPIGVSFNAAQTIEFWPDGTAHVDGGVTGTWPAVQAGGLMLTLSKAGVTRSIAVNGLGRVHLIR